MSWMPDETFVKLKKSLTKHEGRENFPYIDTLGNLTIGIGFNLSARGLSDAWIDQQFSEDANYFYNSLYRDFQFFKYLSEDRQVVLCDMAFMGYKKLLGFKRMFVALKQLDYETAAREMLDSNWANQVKDRAKVLSEAMRSGIYDI